MNSAHSAQGAMGEKLVILIADHEWQHRGEVMTSSPPSVTNSDTPAHAIQTM